MHKSKPVRPAHAIGGTPEFLAPGTPSEPEFISLRHAARKLYEQALLKNKLLARAAEKSGGGINAGLTPASPDESLEFMALRIAECIPVFGRKETSTLLSTIEKSDIDQSTFRDGATVLRNTLYPRAIYWKNLAVKKQDFEAHILKMLS